MKAPLLITFLTGLLLAGAAEGLSGLQAGLESKLGYVAESDNEQVVATTESHELKADRSWMGSEAAAAEDESQQALAVLTAQPEPELEVVKKIFRPQGSEFSTLSLRGRAGERYSIEVFDLSGRRVLHREGILAEDESEFRLNFNHAVDGVYFIRAKAGDRSGSVKYLKQKLG